MYFSTPFQRQTKFPRKISSLLNKNKIKDTQNRARKRVCLSDKRKKEILKTRKKREGKNRERKKKTERESKTRKRRENDL